MYNNIIIDLIKESDPEIADAINGELKRQQNTIELIASENFPSLAVLAAAGSVLTNKYAEGYPGKRYYGGCEFVDKVEQIAIDRAKQLFGAEHANVQPHSGSQANAAVYAAVLQHGDKILAMSLDAGGHLTHGHKLSFSGKDYTFMHYGVERGSETINYDELERLAVEFQPRMIVAGASAYSRFIDFERLRAIADKVGCYLMVDMAHIAGLVAAKAHPSPVPFADFVTTTTHKTLRGPRGGMILCKSMYAAQIDKSVFPGQQGGPLEHIIAAKAIAFKEAMTVEFERYIRQLLLNADILAASLQQEDFRIISGGTDNHLMLVDVSLATGLTGAEAEKVLDSIGITCNKNSIPFDSKPPMKTSGIRLGTAAMTSRGFTEEEFYKTGKIISLALKNPYNLFMLDILKKEVSEMLSKFPLYETEI